MPPQLAPGNSIWWDATEALKLFNASKENETANLMALSYKTIVEGHDADNMMSEHKKEGI
jgi:cellobiose-specific phosphotransferase system component IIA